MKINAQLDNDHSGKLAWLSQATGMGMTEVIKEAIDLYYKQQHQAKSGAKEILENSGFIGCGEAGANLSENYKQQLNESWNNKHGDR